jgi:hypothetical protein
MKNKRVKIIKEVIEPQDRETIKYLSNVEDANTGEISQPFKIGDKSFQIVMGITPSKQEVMAVYCHDDKDENDENILHPVEYFEENVVNPYLKEMTQFGDNIEVNEEAPSLNLSEYNHFYVNERTLNVRKFKTIEEVAKANMNEGETYMDKKQFKTFFENKVFGPRRRRMAKNESLQNDELVDEGLSSFWKTKLRPEVNMVIKQMVSKVKPYIDKLDTPVEKIQYVATLAKMLNLDANSITKLVTALKNLQSSGFGDDNKVEPASTQSTDSNQQQSFATSPVTESKVIRKKDLIVSLNKPKIIKVIKVKDIK